MKNPTLDTNCQENYPLLCLWFDSLQETALRQGLEDKQFILGVISGTTGVDK